MSFQRTSLIALLFLAAPSLAECFMGARFEPPDGRVLHGLGQYIEHFYTDRDNWEQVDQYTRAVGKAPLFYSVYKALDPAADTLSTVRLAGLAGHSGAPQILLVGIVLYDVERMGRQLGTPRIGAEQILSGAWDSRVLKLAEEIKALPVPVFVRPGFEFGRGNLGAHADPDLTPEQFRQIWLRIHRLFRQAGASNAAWVWNTVNPQDFAFLDWYPGDECVDWWGINLFTREQMSGAEKFLDQARRHSKPVMICESCPIHDEGTRNPAVWETWFAPYFSLLDQNSHIKAFTYISDPWDRPGFWEDWADSRLGAAETDSTISVNYNQELGRPRYIHLEDWRKQPDLLGK